MSRHFARAAYFSVWRTLFVLSLTAAVAGCGGSSSTTSTPASPTTSSSTTTTFQGSIAGSGGQTGTLTVAIQATVTTSSIKPLAVSTATGTVHLTGGSTTSLTGSFDSTTNGVSLSGGGFTFTGTISSNVLSGSYSSSSASGGFSSLNATTSTVTTYCGTYGPSFYTGPPANPPGGEIGVWNVQVSSTGAASGSGISKNVAGDPGFLLTGQLSGTTLTLTSFDLLSHKSTGTQTATVQGGTISGSCGGTCLLSGSSSACQ